MLKTISKIWRNLQESNETKKEIEKLPKHKQEHFKKFVKKMPKDVFSLTYLFGMWSREQEERRQKALKHKDKNRKRAL